MIKEASRFEDVYDNDVRICKIEKDALVVRRNDLILGHHKMSLQEMRLFHWLISQIRKDDKKLQRYRVSVKDFCELVQINRSNLYGRDGRLAQLTRTMMRRIIEINDIDEQVLRQRPLLTAVDYKYGEGFVEIVLHDDLRPYLLFLKERFSKMSLGTLLRLNSRYSMRLYERLKTESWTQRRTIEIDLDDLRKFLGVEDGEYERFQNFRMRVLDPAMEELKGTDLIVSYTLERSQRAISKVIFTVGSRSLPLEAAQPSKPIKDDAAESVGEVVETPSQATHVGQGDSEPSYTLLGMLTSIGMPKPEAMQAVGAWGKTDPERIRYHVRECRNKNKPLAWLRAGLKADFRPKGPSPAERARERELEDEERAHDAALRSRPATGGDFKSAGDLLDQFGSRYAH